MSTEEIEKEIPERSAYELDALAFMTIPSKWLEFETDLYTSKWFDYRFMHPVEATYAYADAFEKAWRAAFAQVIDETRAEFVKLYKSHDVFDLKGALLTGLWRGRQIADAIGMPYDVFCTLAMQETLRFWQRRHLPRPMQIYSERVVDALIEKWDEQQGARLYRSDLPQFKAEQYCGTAIQNDHHEWLFAQADRRGNRNAMIASFIRDELLPASKVQARYGEEAFSAISQFQQ